MKTGLLMGCSFIAACTLSSAQKVKKEKSIDKAAATPIIWQRPGPVTRQSMVCGNGSQADIPKPFPDGTFHFVREEIGSTFPKIEVKDANGRKFKVKFANGSDSKSHSEVANNRLLWAMGFRAREIYYVSSGILNTFKPGDPKNPTKKSKMGGKLTKDAAGRFHFKDVSFTAKDDGNLAEDSWGYTDKTLPNSILKSTQFAWMKMFDVLVGNWDPKPENHAVDYVKSDDGRLLAWYADKDVGSGFGNDHEGSGLFRVRPTRWNLKDYKNATFVKWGPTGKNHEVAGDTISLDYATSKSTPHAAEVQKALSSVSKADARRFVNEVLNKISEAAIREAFVTAGGNATEVDGFTNALLNRIQQLRVASGAGSPMPGPDGIVVR